MGEDKGEFVIKKKKPTEKCTNMTVRVDKALLAKYDELASEYGRSRTELVTQAMKFALDHLKRG